MSAIVKACLVKNSVKNTGKECDTSMIATAMLIAVPTSLKFTETDLSDPIAWIKPLLHAAPGQRVFPLFGQTAPIRTITNSSESDVLVTLDDGLQVFLRYGIYNRTFETTSGGLCYASALASLNKSGYNIMEIDQQGQMLIRKNSDGTFSGLITDFMYSPSPILADFKSTPYKNRFQLSYSPVEMVNNGVIFEGATEFLSLSGLIDCLISDEGAQSTTKLVIGVKTECAESDLVALFPTAIADASNFVVKNKATGVAVVPSGVTVVSDVLEISGTFVSGQTYTVTGSAPSIWLTNGIEGYDAENGGVDILIP